ncbi:MAG: DUF998 domain-containing protein [Candidatus Bathyarchaeota archaeon]|nr:MAG: DUF998 domain-containing protein [Candidatus Bathyarchaeota archaeon]
MKLDEAKVAGTLLFLGSIQWFLVIVLTEGLHPDYNSGAHYVSSLGVGTTSLLYNSSLILFGITIVAGAYLLQRAFSSKFFFVLLIVTGFATLGVGLFPEDVRPLHGIVTPIALLFGALSAIVSYRLQKPPLSYVSVGLGVLSLGASVFFNSYLGLPRDSNITFLGLGKGTMERLVIYPILLWCIGFGGHLIGYSKDRDGSVEP